MLKDSSVNDSLNVAKCALLFVAHRRPFGKGDPISRIGHGWRPPVNKRLVTVQIIVASVT